MRWQNLIKQIGMNIAFNINSTSFDFYSSSKHKICEEKLF